MSSMARLHHTASPRRNVPSPRRLRTSRILRIGTLSLGIPSPALGKRQDYPGLITASRTDPHAATAKAIAITGMGDRGPVDQVIAIKWNQ